LKDSENSQNSKNSEKRTEFLKLSEQTAEVIRMTIFRGQAAKRPHDEYPHIKGGKYYYATGKNGVKLMVFDEVRQYKTHLCRDCGARIAAFFPTIE